MKKFLCSLIAVIAVVGLLYVTRDSLIRISGASFVASATAVKGENIKEETGGTGTPDEKKEDERADSRATKAKNEESGTAVCDVSITSNTPTNWLMGNPTGQWIYSPNYPAGVTTAVYNGVPIGTYSLYLPQTNGLGWTNPLVTPALEQWCGGGSIAFSIAYTPPATSTPAITLPQDQGQHSGFLGEWWYLNILTTSDKSEGGNEKRLGHLISFSRVAGNKGLLTSRYDHATKTFKERTDTGGTLDVSLRNSKYLTLTYTHGTTTLALEELDSATDRRRAYKLTGKSGEIGEVNLLLKERHAPLSGYSVPLLWGGETGSCTGKISVFRPHDTYYYSIPNLDVSGTIIDVDGIKRTVEGGKAWMDHQWFNSTPPAAWKGHYWSSMHLADSTNFYSPTTRHQAIGFVTQMYTAGPQYSYWVRRNLDGTNECGTVATVEINSYWPNNYQKSWSLSGSAVEGEIFSLTGSAHSNNQIFVPPFGPQFFEPVSSYTGTIEGTPVSGWGFFETHLKR